MDAIGQFLTASVAVCQAAWSLHDVDEEGHSAGKCNLANLCIALRQTIPSLPDPAAFATDEIAALSRACLKVGRNLEIRLDRAEKAFRDLNAPETRIRAIWTPEILEAFALRLIGMMRQYRAMNSQSNVFAQEERALSSFRYNAPQTYRPFCNKEREIQLPQLSESQSSTNAFESVPESLIIDVRVLKSSKPSQPRNAPVDLLNEFILDHLAFDEMFDREESVSEAHAKTFAWIFSADNHSNQKSESFRQGFSAWLETNDHDPIYWMTGKPGSGKSTLMKYLYEHPATTKLLQRWAGAVPISTAGFFSWASGSRDQRSKCGLFRALLHQLLSVNPHLIPRTFPSLWSKIRTMTTKERIALHKEWDEGELQEAFQLCMHEALSERKICLFIDGLDEFDEDHQELVDLFRRFCLNPNINMCLSSRPWDVFEEAFQTSGPSVTLQEITQCDLQRYALDKLRENVVVRRLVRRETQETQALLQAVVYRANGVFLWIQLALNDILKDFDPEEGISGLRNRLFQLPAELEGLYEKFLFRDQTSSQIAKATSFLLLIEARELVAEFINDTSASSLTVWELAFALEQGDDDCAIDGGVRKVSDNFISERSNDTVQRMRQTFAGLLEIQGRHAQSRTRNVKFSNDSHTVASIRQLADNKVTFIHRTVRDWLRDADVHRQFEQRKAAGFDPHLRLLRSYVLRLKRPRDEIEHHRRFDAWWPDVVIAMTHARYIIDDSSKMQRRFLNQLNQTLSWLWDAKADPYDHWAAKAFGFFHVRKKAPPICHPFLCLATKFGLTAYVSEELDTMISHGSDVIQGKVQLEVDEKATPLLTYATEFLCSREKTVYPHSNPHMIHALLKRPHPMNPGPNHEYIDFETKRLMTSWVSLLRHLCNAHRRRMIGYFDVDLNGIARWADIIKLFMAGGADVDAVVAADSWDPEISTVDVMKMLADTYCAVELEEIECLIGAR